MCFSFEEVGTDEEKEELIEEGKEKLEDGVKEKVEEKVNGLKCVVKAKAIWGFGRWFVTQIAILFALLQKPERPTAFDTFKNIFGAMGALYAVIVTIVYYRKATWFPGAKSNQLHIIINDKKLKKTFKQKKFGFCLKFQLWFMGFFFSIGLILVMAENLMPFLKQQGLFDLKPARRDIRNAREIAVSFWAGVVAFVASIKEMFMYWILGCLMFIDGMCVVIPRIMATFGCCCFATRCPKEEGWFEWLYTTHEMPPTGFCCQNWAGCWERLLFKGYKWFYLNISAGKIDGGEDDE